MLIEIQGETNPARFAGMLMRAQGAEVDEKSFERLAAFCDEPVTDGFSVDTESVAAALTQLCRDSGWKQRHRWRETQTFTGGYLTSARSTWAKPPIPPTTAR